MTGRRLFIVGVLVLAVLAVERGRRAGDDEPAQAQASAEPYVWKVSLDPNGRPYDLPLRDIAKIERRPLAVLHAPSRRVLFMGGEYLSDPAMDLHGSRVTLAERKGRRYPVEGVWGVHRDGYERMVGVVIVESDAPVARWRELDRVAYGTDAGTGGITTAEWAALPDDEREQHETELLDWDGDSYAFDFDGYPGVDVIGFDNGFGDGGFPSIAGYDAAGARAEIVLWSIDAPWRLAFPEGKPPSQVTARENQLAACVAGRRKIEGSTCRIVR